MFDLSGKKALVTGATQGIGLAIAGALVRRGATVYIGGSHAEKCKKAADSIGCFPACCNLMTENAAETLYAITGDVDILVLNASIQYRSPWDRVTGQQFDDQMTVNLKRNLELIQLYAPYMRKQRWGRILTMGSVQQYKPHKDMIVYAAGKCAQMSMVQNLAKDGITVNNLSPGVIDTPRNRDALADRDYAAKVLEGIPCGFVGAPEDCAAAALLLCSEEGRYITGTDLLVDGGMHL